MNQIATGPSRPPRSHLHSPALLARGAVVGADADLNRHHGQGNGLRIHGICFAIVSSATLVLLIVGVAIANTMTR